jgi:hypothetical protein
MNANSTHSLSGIEGTTDIVPVTSNVGYGPIGDIVAKLIPVAVPPPEK